jgi:hypothetical protein
MTVSHIVDRVLAYAHQYGENPLALGLSLRADETGWWVEMEMDAPYDWPHGPESVASLATYDDLGAGFDEMLEGRYLRQHTPGWDQLTTEYEALLEGLGDCAAWPPYPAPALLSHVQELHHRLAWLWRRIEQRRDLDRHDARRALQLTRLAK